MYYYYYFNTASECRILYARTKDDSAEVLEQKASRPFSEVTDEQVEGEASRNNQCSAVPVLTLAT